MPWMFIRGIRRELTLFYMTKGILKFRDKYGNAKIVEIHYLPGSTSCVEDCPIKHLYPDIGPLSGNPTCSILAQRYDARMNTGDRFIDRNCDFYFCSENTIVTAIEIESEEVEIGLGESINRQKKVSLGELIANVCPGRCVFMEDTSKCTEAHRKCPGCLLEELNL